MSITRNERRLARRRLKRLLPRALAAAEASQTNGDGHTITHLSDMGKAFMSHFRLERLDGLHVYPMESGRVHADFYLRDMPDYFPNVIGTPKELPLESEAEAERWAVTQLAAFILAERPAGQGTPPTPDRVPFEVHGYTLFIHTDVVHEVTQNGRISVPEACLVIDNTCREMGNEVTVDQLLELPPTQFAAFYMAISSLLIAGMPRYPLRWPLPH